MTFEIEYQVSLATPQPWLDAALPEQAFVAISSVPVIMHGDRTTNFCWLLPAAASPANAGEKKEGELHCEPFTPGAQLAVPEGITQLQVRTPGSFAVAFDWADAKMMVEMKQYSALLALQFPSLAPDGKAHTYKVKHSLVVVE